MTHFISQSTMGSLQVVESLLTFPSISPSSPCVARVSRTVPSTSVRTADSNALSSGETDRTVTCTAPESAETCRLVSLLAEGRNMFVFIHVQTYLGVRTSQMFLLNCTFLIFRVLTKQHLSCEHSSDTKIVTNAK